MEVTITPPNLDFYFIGGSTLKPQYYFSAPTTPDNLYQFCKNFDGPFPAASAGDRTPGGLSNMRQFDREGKTAAGSRKLPLRDNNGDDFAFDVSQEWETASLSADELFDGGVIKPLTLPPPLKLRPVDNCDNIIGKPAPQTRRVIQVAGSRPPPAVEVRSDTTTTVRTQRGRETTTVNSSKLRAARSLSPQRNMEYPKGQKKWRLKDLFLFRSASEGRASDKDHLKKYSVRSRRSSFSAIDTTGSGSRRKGSVSAHELHYTVNRAISEDLKKKTFLPYNQGIVGRLAFNPAAHALANGFGFSRR